MLFAVIDLKADAGVLKLCGELANGLHDALALLRLTRNRHDDNLCRRQLWRNDDAVIVTMAHDQCTYHSSGESPTRRINEFARSLFGLESHVECFRKILSEMMRRTGLQC